MDSTSGMGFGTTISPLLLLMYSPLTVVPALLVSQTVCGMIAGVFHGEFENVEFFTMPISPAFKKMLLIAGIGCVGTVISIILVYYSLKPSQEEIKLYVSGLLILMGLISLINVKKKKYNEKILVGFAVIAGFNKGIGGGGYGPVVTLGQTLSGIYEKSAVGITTLAEGITSLIGSICFFLLSFNTSLEFNLFLLPSIFTGAFFASLISPYMVRVLPNKLWRVVIPIYAFSIGILTLIQLVF